MDLEFSQWVRYGTQENDQILKQSKWLLNSFYCEHGQILEEVVWRNFIKHTHRDTHKIQVPRMKILTNL